MPIVEGVPTTRGTAGISDSIAGTDAAVAGVVIAVDLLTQRGVPVRLLIAGQADPANPASIPDDEIAKNLDIGQALADLRYAAGDVADLVRDVQHLPDPLLRSGLLFAPASKLTPSVARLHDRATGRYVAVLPDELPELASIARSAARLTDTAFRTLDQALSQGFPLAIAGAGYRRTASVPEL